MTLSEKTKIGLSIGQMIALIFFIFSVSGGFIGVGTTASEANNRSKTNEIRIQRMDAERTSERDRMLLLIQEIRESQIRIEEALKLKQDKKWIE